jgi:hypothetical protein
LGAAVGLGAVSRGEFFEQEAGAFGDVLGVACGIDFGGILKAGGVLEGEAIFVEGVCGDDFHVGEAEAFVTGLGMFSASAVEGGAGIAEKGGIRRLRPADKK